MLIFLLCTLIFSNPPVDILIVSPCEYSYSPQLEPFVSQYIVDNTALKDSALRLGKLDSLVEIGDPRLALLEEIDLSSLATIEMVGMLEFELSNYSNEFRFTFEKCTQPADLEIFEYIIHLESVAYTYKEEFAELTAKLYVSIPNSDVPRFDDYLVVQLNDEHSQHQDINLIHALNLELAKRIVYDVL